MLYRCHYNKSFIYRFELSNAHLEMYRKFKMLGYTNSLITKYLFITHQCEIYQTNGRTLSLLLIQKTWRSVTFYDICNQSGAAKSGTYCIIMLYCYHYYKSFINHIFLCFRRLIAVVSVYGSWPVDLGLDLADPSRQGQLPPSFWFLEKQNE